MVACFGGHTICTGLLYSTGLIHIALLKKFRADDAKTTWASAVFIAMMSFAGKLYLLFFHHLRSSMAWAGALEFKTFIIDL